ncbi:MAG TPA: hypothetical protein VM716_03070 [Gemmatimonadales bacterium]|nr:hypothetical protein [Gemmatimonadales bacterium]
MNALRYPRFGCLIIAALALLSCTDHTPVGPPLRADLVGSSPHTDVIGLTPGPTGLLRCAPLAAASVTQTIGPTGGTLYVGVHQLTVPAGALLAPTTITAVAPSDTVNQIRFQPEGLVFLLPATLQMSYGNCDLLGQVAPKEIAYTTDELRIREYLLSSDDVLSQRVTASLQHFSTYAVAW